MATETQQKQGQGEVRKNISKLQAQIESSGEKLDFLGHTVMWRLSGLRVTHPDLEATLKAIGLEEFTPKTPSQTLVLSRSVQAWLKDRIKAGQMPGMGQSGEDDEDTAGSGTKTRSLLRKINGAKSDWLIYSLVLETVDLTALGLSYGTTLRVCLHKTQGFLKVTQVPSGTVTTDPHDGSMLVAETQQLRSYFSSYQDVHLSADLSILLRHLLGTCQAASIRYGGGAYFVPKAMSEQLMKIKELVDTAWPSPNDPYNSSFMLTVRVVDNATDRKDLAKATYQDFMNELVLMQTDMVGLNDQSNKGGNVRKDTLTSRLSKFKAMQHKASIYAETLGMQQEFILEQLSKLEAQAKELILSTLDSLNDDDSEVGDETETEADVDTNSISTSTAFVETGKGGVSRRRQLVA